MYCVLFIAGESVLICIVYCLLQVSVLICTVYCR